MKTSDFSFELPDELIAQYPTQARGDSRLLVVCADGLGDHQVRDLPDLLPEGSLLVFNNSKVRKARLYGRPVDSGEGARQVEIVFLRRISPTQWTAVARPSRRLAEGRRIELPDGVIIEGVGKEGEELLVRSSHPLDEAWFEANGHVPLPPYIKRSDEIADESRYQTVYAGELGSAAAPTAGLHFTEDLLDRLDHAGMERVFVTLHVGLGTFAPVRTQRVEDHHMHREYYAVSEEAARRVNAARESGRPVVAVGTTAMRTLESAGSGGSLVPGEGFTEIFIYPGYRFRMVDVLFTNFHTPESTLFMLVCAFAGSSRMKDAYLHAVEKGYRFFSYGDATLLFKDDGAAEGVEKGNRRTD